MTGISEWINRNPRGSAAGAAAVLLLTTVLLYCFVLNPGSGDSTLGQKGTPASAYNPVAAANSTISQTGQAGTNSMPATSDPDAIPMSQKRHGGSQPGLPWWSERPIVPTISTPSHNAPVPARLPVEPVGKPAAQLVFVPPSPPVFVHGAAYVSPDKGSLGSQPGVVVPPLIEPPRIEDYVNDPASDELDTIDRISGVVADGDRVVAVVERSAGGNAPTSYVVQPGDRIGVIDKRFS